MFNKTRSFLITFFILFPVFAFCTQAGQSENNMTLNVTDLPNIGTAFSIDAYTIETASKCYITTYFGDVIIDYITPYQNRDVATTLSSIQYLFGDKEKLITQSNGVMHTNVLLSPLKYAANQTYGVLVECGSSSCVYQNFTTSQLRLHTPEIIGLNVVHGLATNTQYLINLVIVLIFIGVPLNEFVIKKIKL